MSNNNEARTGKKRNKKSKKYNLWLIIGVVALFLAVFVVFLFVYGLNLFGLRGVSFIEESGFYNNDLFVEIEPEGFLLINKPEIKFNMNGDDLDESGDWYSGAIKLEVPEKGYKLYTITARSCKKDGDCTKPEVATYVLGKNLDEDVTIDVININSSQNNLYDYEKGIMVGGRTYDENQASGYDSFVDGNYSNRGKDWLRNAYITRFDRIGNTVWDQEAYIGISGGTSSAYEIKSLKIKMEDLAKDEILTLRLRSGSQDQFSGNIRSSVVDRLAEECGFSGRAGTRRVVVFLNGEYYGIFDMQKTYSEQNIKEMFKLEKKKKVKKSRGSEISVFGAFGVDGGIWEDLELSENRAALEGIIDMDDYLKYYAIMILVNNTDWPMNNFEAWRYADNIKTNNQYMDGRIRFLIRDTDLIYYTDENIRWFDSVAGDIFTYLMEDKNNGHGSSFRKVMMSSYYRERFVALLCDLINGPFATENVLKIIDEEAEKIRHQEELFYDSEEYDEWARQIDLMKKAVRMREGEIRIDLKKYFEVEI